PADSRNDGDDARLRRRPAHRAGLGRRLAVEPGLRPSRSHPAPAGRLDPHGLGNLGDESKGQILFADQGRTKTAPRRSGELGEGGRPGGALSRGVVVTLRRAASGLLALLRKRRLDRELEGEILAHLELAERDALAAGLSPEEARRAARRRFGGIEQMKEEHRGQRSAQWIETLLRDFRYGLASVVRDPGFSAIVVGVLALGIGANVAMFSLVDAVLLKPLPFPDPGRIVAVWEAPRRGVTNATSTPDFLDWKRLGTVFEALSAEQPIAAALTGNGEPASLRGKAVT